MAFCPNCGTEATGAFCPNCGTALGGAAPNTGPGAAGATTGAYVPPAAASAPGLETNIASALCYLAGLITGIIFLVLAPYNQNKTVRFHAFQSIFLTIAWIVLEIILGMLGMLTHGLFWLLYPLLGIAALIVWLYMMYTAYTNKKVKLPIVGDLAEKQA